MITDSDFDYKTSFSSLKEAIKNRDNQGWQLYDISYGDGIWFAVFNKSDCNTSWAYNFAPSMETIVKNFRERKSNGFHIMNINFGYR